MPRPRITSRQIQNKIDAILARYIDNESNKSPHEILFDRRKAYREGSRTQLTKKANLDHLKMHHTIKTISSSQNNNNRTIIIPPL